MKVGKIDVEDSEELQSQYEVESFPSVVFFKDGMMYTFEGGLYERDLIFFASKGYKTSTGVVSPNSFFKKPSSKPSNDQQEAKQSSEEEEEDEDVYADVDSPFKEKTKASSSKKSEKDKDLDFDDDDDEEDKYDWPNDPDTVVLNSTNFENETLSGIWLIEFYAHWCPHVNNNFFFFYFLFFIFYFYFFIFLFLFIFVSLKIFLIFGPLLQPK